MTRSSRLKPLFALLTALGLLCMTSGALANENRYRVELIVFKNLNVLAEADSAPMPRRFPQVFELDNLAPGEVPRMLEKQDGSFANIWTRLDRLGEYEPVVRLTYEQTFYDYHPPVRVHNDVVMARENRFPPDVIYLKLADYPAPLPGQETAMVDLLKDYEALFYQLDGSIQLRRSRFLHIDLDLEFRLDGPAWEREFPSQPEDMLEPGFEWALGTPPETADAEPASEPSPVTEARPAIVADGSQPMDTLEPAALPEPFRFHRLTQSRQIRSNTLQYFDSAFLGAIVRVSPIADASESTQ